MENDSNLNDFCCPLIYYVYLLICFFLTNLLFLDFLYNIMMDSIFGLSPLKENVD